MNRRGWQFIEYTDGPFGSFGGHATFYLYLDAIHRHQGRAVAIWLSVIGVIVGFIYFAIRRPERIQTPAPSPLP